MAEGTAKKPVKKKEAWIKPRHRVIRTLLFPFFYLYCKWRYGLTVERLPKAQRRQCLILYNHQTPFDQFFVALTMRDPVYYLATEDIFSNGWISRLLRYAVAPIPIKKSTTDVRAVMNCIKVAREGGTIAIAPEGNRTYSGKTEYISPSIATLARKLKLPIAFLRLEGGYGVQPRWSDVIRRGTMRAYISRTMEPEEYAGLDNDQLCELICRELYVNEAAADRSFFHQKSAEYLERAIYVCPQCGLSSFESHGDEFGCLHCGCKVRYLPTKELQGVGFESPFRFVNDWYEYQADFINRLDPALYMAEPVYRDTVDIYKVIVYQHKEPFRKGVEMCLYGDRIVLDAGSSAEIVLPFSEISAAAVLGRNKLNLYHGDDIYQIRGGKRYNALKYVNFCYHYKNVTGETKDGKFLGL